MFHTFLINIFQRILKKFSIFFIQKTNNLIIIFFITEKSFQKLIFPNYYSTEQIFFPKLFFML